MTIRQKKTTESGFKRQRCRVCKCEDKFNYYVPDALWREIVAEEYQDKVVCLPCFDEFARKRRIIIQSRSTCFILRAGRRASNSKPCWRKAPSDIDPPAQNSRAAPAAQT